MRLRTLLVFTGLFVATCASGTRIETPVTVSAAASLSDALESAARAYEQAGGGPVRFNFAGSNVLARQIAGGAPVDIFMSADEAQMAVARAHSAIDEPTIVDLLGNRLAVITRPGRGSSLPDVQALVGSGVRRVAIGDPAAVPAGVYARKYLEAIGAWSDMEGRVVPVGNVRAALTAVESGSADAAIVYESDTVAARSIDVAFVVTDPAAPRIVYPAALVAASRNRHAAARFLEFLQGAEAAAIFRQHKFVPLAR